MSGFSPDWLALREPADHGSVNAQVREACVRTFEGRDSVRIVDLGSGTGSNLRGLSPAITTPQHWTLVDYDDALLSAAKSRAGERTAPNIEIAYQQADLSSGGIASLIAEADLVTASALFDLVSVDVIERIAGDIAAKGCAFYAVLTYDGLASWLPEHPADTAMRDAFNAHQRSDKGFGLSAGPDATQALATALMALGYTVRRGMSPWVLDQTYATLRQEVDRGWAAAVRETNAVPIQDIDDWLNHRLGHPDAVTIVGHEDLLALPPVH